MAMFKSVENSGGLMAEGDYEVYVKNVEETKTKNGIPCIKFDFVVRSDVDQAYKNKHIFKNFYQDHETGEYPAEKIGKFANALGIEKGQEFYLEDLIGRNCILRMTHFTGNDGVERECIFYAAPSKAAPYMAIIPPAADYEMIDDDEQLPF